MSIDKTGILLASDDGSFDGSNVTRTIEYVPAIRKLRVTEERGVWHFPTAHTDGACEVFAESVGVTPLEVWETLWRASEELL